MTAKHSPLPWLVEERPTSIGRCFCIGNAEQLAATKSSVPRIASYACLYDDYGVGLNTSQANASLIVEAVNNYATLRSQRDELVEALRESHSKLLFIKHRDSQWHNDDVLAILKRNDAALAKVTR